jgi:hypothetical protein
MFLTVPLPVAEYITLIMSNPQISISIPSGPGTMEFSHLHGLIFETSILYWQDQPDISTQIRICCCPRALGIGVRRIWLDTHTALSYFPRPYNHGAQGPTLLLLALVQQVSAQEIQPWSYIRLCMYQRMAPLYSPSRLDLQETKSKR